MNAITNTVSTVKLSQLRADPGINSRLFDKEAGVKELAQHIKVEGLLQPILVRPTGEEPPTFTVVDGERRFAALQLLGGDPDVNVTIRPMTDAEARNHSLAANVMRLDLHPADQFAAFKAMVDAGVEIEKISQAYGISKKQVKQRLALGAVIPEVLNLYRAGKVNHDLVQQYATADVERQRAVYDRVTAEPNWAWWQLRDGIRASTVLGSDGIAKFVGKKAYVDAGGLIETDLFNDTERWVNGDLLEKLAVEQIEKKRAKLLKDGWAWVALESELKSSVWNMPRIYPETKRTAEADARIAEIEKLLGEPFMQLLGECEAGTTADDLTDEALLMSGASEEDLTLYPAEAERQPLLEELFKLQNSGKKEWTKEQKAEAGVIINRSYEVEYGYLNKKKTVDTDNASKTADDKAKAKKETGGLNEALQGDLQSVLTASVQVALAEKQQKLAVELLVAAMVDKHLNEYSAPLSFSSNAAHSDRSAVLAPNVFDKKLSEQIKGWKIPKGKTNEKKLAAVRAAIKKEGLEQILAVLAAAMVHKVHPKEELPKLVGKALNIRGVWTPDEAFFKRLNSEQLREVLIEAGVHQKGEGDKLKKGELVALAAEKVPATKWVPKFIAPKK